MQQLSAVFFAKIWILGLRGYLVKLTMFLKMGLFLFIFVLFKQFTALKQRKSNLDRHFKRNGQPRPLFHLFSVFSNKQHNFSTNQCETCPSIIKCQDSNPQPLEHESSPITTRPGHFIYVNQTRQDLGDPEYQKIRWFKAPTTTVHQKNCR